MHNVYILYIHIRNQKCVCVLECYVCVYTANHNIFQTHSNLYACLFCDWKENLSNGAGHISCFNTLGTTNTHTHSQTRFASDLCHKTCSQCMFETWRLPKIIFDDSNKFNIVFFTYFHIVAWTFKNWFPLLQIDVHPFINTNERIFCLINSKQKWFYEFEQLNEK